MRAAPIRPREVVAWIVLNALWIPLTFQDAALMTIAVPAALLRLAPTSYVGVLSVMVSTAMFAAMIVPPIAGWFSDRLRRRGGVRRTFVAVALLVDVVALLALAFAHTLVSFGAWLTVAIVSANVALAAYQVLLPELVPRARWGVVSGVRGAASLFGTVLGLGIAGLAPDPRITFAAAAATVLVCGISLGWIREPPWSEPDRAHVRDWHDFTIVFAARVLVFFGLVLLQTFVLYYFRDVQGVHAPAAGTALAAFCTMLGATAASVYLGILSDRAPRKIVAALACVPMAVAAIGFAIAPAPQWIFLYAFLFGIGFGGVFSVGWALAMDSIPAMRDVARDLGLWGIASNLPNVVAPLVGGWLIGYFHGGRAGYQAVFALAGLSFALASLTVLRVGRTPLSSLWGLPARIAANVSNYAWVHAVYRVRHWGAIPRRRGPTLIVANYQHELESMTIVVTTFVESGPWRHPIFSANSRRMYEPGFLALRLPRLAGVLRPFNFGPLFVALGLLPLENQISSRQISALALSAQRRHGPLPLDDVFDERVSKRFPAGTKTSDLSAPRFFGAARASARIASLREPYRHEVIDETRAFVESDMARMEDVVRRGATFYLTPEGRYSVDGRIGPMRGAIDRLAPLAAIYLAGVSYDPFVARRLSMLYRIEPLSDRAALTQTLAAIRPVVASQLLAAWLDGRSGEFSGAQAVAAVEERLRALPPQIFVDPELRRDPGGLVRRALPLMVEWGILEPCGRGFRLSAHRRHPQFPMVEDIVAYQARHLEQTLENAAYSPVRR
ncbi:MAG TPA: MFS transporter [Candidatus Tumulicola sp.]